MMERDQYQPAIDLGETLRSSAATVRRRWQVLVVFLVLITGLAVYQVLEATPLYTARGSIIIDPRTDQTPVGPAQHPSLLMSDALTVDSEVQVLRSRDVTGRAVAALGLYDAPDSEIEPGFIERLATTVRGLYGGLSDTPAPVPSDNEVSARTHQESIRRDFVESLSVARSGETYVIDISYTSPGRQYAADAVNTVIEQYLGSSTERQTQNSERIVRWLSERLEQLAADVARAETAVADYRAENELFEARGEQTPAELELSAATDELIRLRSRLLETQLRIEQLNEQIATGSVDSVNLAENIATSALKQFETRYAELLQEEQEALLQRSDSSSLVEGIRKQKTQVRELIVAEIAETRDRLVAQQEILQRRVDATDAFVAELRQRTAYDARKSIQLRNLEREAEAKRRLYEKMLEEFNSSAQLTTFDTSPARVISWAVPPDRKSQPNSKRIVLAAVFAALVLGATAAFVVEALDNSLRTPDEIRELLGLSFLGVVPTFGSDRARLPGRRKPESPGNLRTLGRAGQRLRFAADMPRSMMTKTLRATQIQASLRERPEGADGNGNVIGVVSATKGEGKTTLSANFATLLAQQSLKAVLVDFDLIANNLTRCVSPILPDTNMLQTWLSNRGAGVSGMFEPMEEFDGLTVVGTTGDEGLHPTNPQDAATLGEFLKELSVEFDYVIVDLPPALGPAETRVLAGLCDCLVLTVHWGTTSHNQLTDAMIELRAVKQRITGAVFNKARLRAYLSYNGPRVGDYYHY